MENDIKADWMTSAGLRAVVLLHPNLGHNCGYVGVPEGHPAHGLGYENLDVDVHGGVTFAKDSPTYPIASSLWWLGFDCGHAGDSPSPEWVEEQKGVLRDVYSDLAGYGVYRDVDYVKAECESLAEQLQKIAHDTP